MIDFDISPYYDDTVENAIPNNYLRILFKPGFAVQARELTALQSILQNQISQLGDFVFQDGSPVSGGHITIDTSVTSVQFQQQFANVDINITDFLPNGNSGLILNSSNTTTVKAQSMAIDTTQSNPTLLIKYLTATEFNNGDTVQLATGAQDQATLLAANAQSNASIASINPGVFYSGGMFIEVPAQTIVLDSFSTTPSARIGLQINENIINYSEDSTLLDPAQASFNYQGPGADRYQYTLTLAAIALDSEDDTAFYELLRLENGLIISQVSYPILGDIGNILAARTYDEAGDFVVKPFLATPSPNQANSSQFCMLLSPGKAYVKGFEFETVGIQRTYLDKGLSTNTVNSYGMSLEFGNQITVTNYHGGNISGTFDTSNFQTVDLHYLTSNNIVTTNVQTYTASKLGTAKVRDIEFLGLSDYYVYLLDINITPNSFYAQTSSNINAILFPPGYSSVANAYLNVFISVTTVGNYTDQRYITGYNGSTRTANLSAPLTYAPTTSSNCVLNYAFKDVESLVITPNTFTANVYYNQSTGNGLYACADIAPAGKAVGGNTILSDIQFNTLIYTLPTPYVAQNTISNASFTHRKNLWSQSFTSGNLTISSGSGLGSGESYPYGFTGAYLPDSTANVNFIIIVRNAQSSGYANGQVLNMDYGTYGTSGNGVFQTDNTHVTLTTSAHATFVGDVYLTVTVTNAGSASVSRRTKTLLGNTANTVLLSTDSYLNGNVVIGTSNVNTVYVDTTNAYVWFTNWGDINKIPGNNNSLYIPDVFGITKVYTSGATNFAPNAINAIDITSNFSLDSGQRDNYYDHAHIILNNGATPPNGQTVVIFQGYQADTPTSPVQGFFDADSYSTAAYANNYIPYYSSPVYGSISLRDSIDFRPTRTAGFVANVQTFALGGLDLPNPNFAMTLSYNFYLSRIDKILLNKQGVFKIKQGTPAQQPTPPADSDDSMTLYVVSIPPYTANLSQIGLQYVENKRYTMKDIGLLDARITQLEEVTQLTSLEIQGISEQILYQNGVTAKDQYGVLSDDFGDYSVADDTNPDFVAYLQQNSMSPYKLQSPWDLNLISTSGPAMNTSFGGGINQTTYCLPFTEAVAINQNTATEAIAVQPYAFGEFAGSVTLAPSCDYWYSTQLLPAVIATPAKPVTLPPAPAEPAAPALKANIPAAPVQVVASPKQVTDLKGSTYVTGYYDLFGLPGYYFAEPSVYNYGVLSATTNWFGIPAATVKTGTINATAQISTSIPTAINLPAYGLSTATSATIKIL